MPSFAIDGTKVRECMLDGKKVKTASLDGKQFYTAATVITVGTFSTPFFNGHTHWYGYCVGRHGFPVRPTVGAISGQLLNRDVRSVLWHSIGVVEVSLSGTGGPSSVTLKVGSTLMPLRAWYAINADGVVTAIGGVPHPQRPGFKQGTLAVPGPYQMYFNFHEIYRTNPFPHVGQPVEVSLL